MFNINKKKSFIKKILKHSNFTKKIYLYMSSKAAGDDYDPYEDNYTFSNLNPIIIKGYVSELSPEALAWKQYGLQNMGAKEIICRSLYKNAFENCNKIEIDNDEYQVFKDGTSGKTLISNRPNKLIRVVITRKT